MYKLSISIFCDNFWNGKEDWKTILYSLSFIASVHIAISSYRNVCFIYLKAWYPHRMDCIQNFDCELKLLYRRYWQLFRYMYHANANLFKLVSLSSLNSLTFNNSYNPLTVWVSFAWFVIILYQASIVIHNFK